MVEKDARGEDDSNPQSLTLDLRSLQDKSDSNQTPTTRRKSHIMATPEQLGMTLLQQNADLLPAPTSCKRRKGVSFDPVVSFPELCALVQPESRVVAPAYEG